VQGAFRTLNIDLPHVFSLIKYMMAIFENRAASNRNLLLLEARPDWFRNGILR